MPRKQSEKTTGFDSSAWFKKRYAARKDAGLCVMCGKAAPKQGCAYCVGCLEKQAARQTARIAKKNAVAAATKQSLEQQWREAGHCVGCGSPDKHTTERCRRCEVLYLQETLGISYTDAKRRVGVCQRCPNHVQPGELTCADCLRIANEKHNAQQSNGLCVDCGMPREKSKSRSRCVVCAGNYATRYAARKAHGLCAECGRSAPIDGKVQCQPCLEYARKKNNRKYAKLRAEVFAAYGGKCACCGETNQDYLQVDHVFNDGAAHRRSLLGDSKGCGGTRMYTWLRKHGFPQDRFCLLCANCNFAKAKNGGVCPHEVERREALEKLTPETPATEDSTL